MTPEEALKGRVGGISGYGTPLAELWVVHSEAPGKVYEVYCRSREAADYYAAEGAREWVGWSTPTVTRFAPEVSGMASPVIRRTVQERQGVRFLAFQSTQWFAPAASRFREGARVIVFVHGKAGEHATISVTDASGPPEVWTLAFPETP